MIRAIVWTNRALRRLDDIGSYIAVDNPEAAERVISRILSAVESLTDRPAIGRPGRIRMTCELVLVDIPYIIPYSVSHETIEILTIMHSAQKWPVRL